MEYCTVSIRQSDGLPLLKGRNPFIWCTSVAAIQSDDHHRRLRLILDKQSKYLTELAEVEKRIMPLPREIME